MSKYFILVTGFVIQLLAFFYDVGDTGYSVAIAPLALGALALGGGAALNSWANSQNRDNAEYSLDMQKRLMDYEWKNFNSPKAQAASLAEVGINPSVAFGQGGFGRGVAPSGTAPQLSQSDIGLSGQDFANTILALSQAKKAGSETAGVNLDNLLKGGALTEAINSVALDNAAKRFQLELNRWFAAPEKVANITLAWKNALLKDDEHSINEFRKTFEKYSSELKGIERDSAKKVFDNMDTVILQQNKQREEDIRLTQEKQKTERSSQSANTASARASNAAADYTQSQKKYQDIVNDIKESGKTFELENLIRRWQSENKVADATAEQAYTMLARYRQLNENDKNSAAKYLNYMFWYFKEQMPNLPIVPFLNIGK